MTIHEISPEERAQKERENAIIAALEVSDSVHESGAEYEGIMIGEVEAAQMVFYGGIQRLRYMERYEAHDEESISELNSELEGLRRAIWQRQKTAIEIVESTAQQLN